MNFRALTPKETDCRVKSVVQRQNWLGVMLLLYKNARADMNILDETVGPEKWQRDHFECKGNLFCRVGILVDRPNGSEWVWKADCGSESNTEKEKGESSDSFKRACINWGIGRELYTAPTIMIDSNNCNIFTDSKGKQKCNDPFYVREMVVKNGRITHLVIFNGAKNIYRNVYEYNAKV